MSKARGHWMNHRSGRCLRFLCIAWFRVLRHRTGLYPAARDALPLTQSLPELPDITAAGFQQSTAHLVNPSDNGIGVQRFNWQRKPLWRDNEGRRDSFGHERLVQSGKQVRIYDVRAISGQYFVYARHRG